MVLRSCLGADAPRSSIRRAKPWRAAAASLLLLAGITTGSPAANLPASAAVLTPTPNSPRSDGHSIAIPAARGQEGARPAAGAAIASPELSARSTPAPTRVTVPLPPAVSPEEERIGREGVKEVETEYETVKDPPTLLKLQQMIAVIEKATPYPDLHYTVNIVRSRHPRPEPEVNAFSLPGGFIFVTKDLLDMVQSDDELAAVMAHEMAHVVHHHVIRQIRDRNHDQMVSIVPILVDLLLHGFRPSADTPSIAVMSQQVVQALQSPHSIHDETEADLSGIDYLVGSGKYDPVGMMTFMRRLAQAEERRVQIDLGYLQTHPSSAHRVEDIQHKLAVLEVPINVRKVTKALMAQTEKGSRPGTFKVRMKKLEICTLTASPEGVSAERRAERAVRVINRALDENRPITDLDVRIDGESATVVWGRAVLFTITPPDAALVHQAPGQAATQAADQLRRVLWADQIDNS